jgi:hypothetical protein
MKSLLLVVTLAVLVASCGGAKTVESKQAAETTASKMRRIDDGARCETEGRVESLVDLNQDGVADVRKVFIEKEGEAVLVWREVDLDFDGVKDLFHFFDENGQKIRDEANLDYTGTSEIVTTYSKGKVVKQEYDTNSDGIVDRLAYLEDDVPVRVEGDTDGDQQIDYWEYYEGGKLIRIGQDKDGDGRVDTWSRDDETEAAVLEEQEEPQGESEEGEAEEPAEEKPDEEPSEEDGG